MPHRVFWGYSSGLDILHCRQGPHRLLHAASLFHVDYRIYKNKKCRLQCIVSQFIGSASRCQQKYHLDDEHNHPAQKPAEGGQAPKPAGSRWK